MDNVYGSFDKTMNGKSYNQLNPHALWEVFSSIIQDSAVPDTIVDFWLGPSNGEMNRVYKGVQFVSLKGRNLKREEVFSVTVKQEGNDANKK